MAGPIIKPSRASLMGIGLCLVAITLFHYLTSAEAIASHDIYRRLYYLPIVWAAFTGGLWYGLGVALVATLAYLPHAFFLHQHHDPAPEIDKVLEIVLYFGVAILAGWLVDRERRARRREEQAALEKVSAEARAERLSGLVHLSHGLAHEIRNPLGGIQGAIEILAEEVPAASPRREMVEVGLREVGRLNSVLTKFLDFARPPEPIPKEFAPEALLHHVVELLAPEAKKGGVELGVDPGAVPAALGDQEQITQVLVNLVQNALQATPAGGSVRLAARLAKVRAEDRLLFEVSDTGRGVDPALGNSIYDPYVSGREGGTGLGLSISALLVRQHGGDLSHRARQGGGTVFFFDLPLAAGGRS